MVTYEADECARRILESRYVVPPEMKRLAQLIKDARALARYHLAMRDAARLCIEPGHPLHRTVTQIAQATTLKVVPVSRKGRR